MKISLTDAGKRFNRDWVFRHLSYEFHTGRSYAITGPNGSGKSTLLQVLSGSMELSEGMEEWADNRRAQHQQPETGNRKLSKEEVYKHIAICAPYLELIEEMTLTEFLEFHHHFKPFISTTTTNQIITTLGLEEAAHKQIRYFSSGMKQRVKLAQAVFSDVAVVLLDEPCTNFDAAGISLYHRLINDYCKNRLVIVSSNDEVEYGFCEESVEIIKFKK
jgi:ABC-type multidrug transport system ATPase subunit